MLLRVRANGLSVFDHFVGLAHTMLTSDAGSTFHDQFTL